MSKPVILGQSSQKHPKKMLKSNTQQINLNIHTNSKTPTIKIINNPIYIQTNPQLRETQSYANSPQNKNIEYKSLRASSSPKEKAEIETLLRNSLLKFKHEKKELEKIKEFAQTWKENRKKKLEDYNLQTRIENKFKFKFEPFRPRTAWGSPEIKENHHETKHIHQRNSGFSSTERRANIGLEFYNVKSPRNGTPKVLKDSKKPPLPTKKNSFKKDIEEYIKKKRKERKKKEKNEKEKEEELELKRVSELMKIDRVAKKVINKRKKSKNKSKNKEKNGLKKSKSRPNLKENIQRRKSAQKESASYSEDEEVVHIMQVRKPEKSEEEEQRGGRECVIFGNFSNQFSSEGANATEIAHKILGKHAKSEKNSILISASMPIIELKSVSNDSFSSDMSEKKDSLKKKLEDLKKRMEKAKDIVEQSFTEHGVDIDIGLHKLIDWIKEKYLFDPFFSIKAFQKAQFTYVETPQLSGFNTNKDIKEEEKKEELEIMLSNLASGRKESKEGSADMDRIWDKIDYISKTTDFLNNQDPLEPLTPIDDENSEVEKSTPEKFEIPEILPLKLPAKKNESSEKSSSVSQKISDSSQKILATPQASQKSSGKPSNELSNSIIDQLKQVHFPSAEFLSFGNIGEVTHEDLIDSPSLMSIVSRNSSEIFEKTLNFLQINEALTEISPQNEPAKPVFFSKMKHPSPILIDDGNNSVSLSEHSVAVKESSSIATPEAEEIEEFSSIDFDLNFKRPNQVPQETSLNPFSISEETLELDEDEISKKVVFCLTLAIYNELIYEGVYDDFKKKNYQLIGNAALVMHEVCVRTGIMAILNFVDKVWAKLSSEPLKFVDLIKQEKNGAKRLAVIQENLKPDEIGKIVPESVLENAEKPSEYSISLSLDEKISEPVKIHNKMIFDCINECLSRITDYFFPPFWRLGLLPRENVDVEFIFQDVSAEIKKFCSVCAGRIPTIAMIGANGQLDEESLQKIRENGLAAMLSIDINNEENMWVNYENEETQAKIDLSDIIMEMLVIEIVQFLR